MASNFSDLEEVKQQVQHIKQALEKQSQHEKDFNNIKIQVQDIEKRLYIIENKNKDRRNEDKKEEDNDVKQAEMKIDDEEDFKKENENESGIQELQKYFKLKKKKILELLLLVQLIVENLH